MPSAKVRERRSRDQGGVHDGTATQQSALVFEVCADRFEDRLGQVVRFEQAAEVEDRRLAGNCIATKL